MIRIKHFMLILLVGLAGHASAQQAQRIVSLIPSITKCIYQLGAEEQLVGCTNFCQLNSPDDAQVVASAMQVNVEKCMLLKPDLVIVGSFMAPKTKELLQKMKVNILELPFPKSFEGICQQMLTLGQQIGKSTEAQALVEQAKERLAVAQSKIPSKDTKPSVFIQIGANPLFGVIPNTFMDDFITLAQCQNMAQDMTNGVISREAVLLRNPDYIFVTFMGSMGNDEIEKWKAYAKLKAVEQQHIFDMDAHKACSPTPSDFIMVLEQIIAHIYH